MDYRSYRKFNFSGRFRFGFLFFFSVLICSFVMGKAWSQSVVLNAEGKPANSIFEFNVESAYGGEVSLSKYKGKKAYLCVNVASE
jgi:hypothetical protein